MTGAADGFGQSAERPVVASYCATFLKPEMLHIYRQITALQRVRPVVIAQKREHAERFPFDDLTLVRKPASHFLRRIWYRQLRDAPWMISRTEVAELIRVLERKKASLLHIYFGHIAVHLLPLITGWARRSVVSFHGADVMVDLDQPAYRDATSRMLEAVELVLVRSYSLRNALVKLGCPEHKIRLQRTGIPLDLLAFCARNWPGDGSWQFLQASRLIEKKGFGTSLRAFAAFHAQYPRARFTIAGEGPLLERLKQTARELGIAEHVTFAGFVSEPALRELYYRSHIFLHPSETGADGNQEGVPNAMLEAMATGLPVFATRHGGIPEAIEDGVSGRLVDEGDADALAHSLLDTVLRPERLSEFGRRGAQTVSENFEQTAQVSKLEDFYFEAMAGGRA